MAPLIVVRGNVDRDPWADELPESFLLEVEGKKLFVLHDLGRLHAKAVNDVPSSTAIPMRRRYVARESDSTSIPEVPVRGDLNCLLP